MNQQDKPLTTSAVAAIFGVTTTTVKRWADSGKLSSFKTPGGHYRFTQADIDAFKASTTTEVGVA